MTSDNYLDYCVKIARNGLSFVSPNPLVGSIVVYNNQIIGEGWHSQYGGDHAERKAILSIASHDKKYIPFSTLYVSLEPCNHTGKTPPCTQLIIDSGIKNVVIDTLDPNPIMCGRSAEILKKEGIKVHWRNKYLNSSVDELNKTFFININENRPYIILKWAQSVDGMIGKKGQPIKISNQYSDILTHKWRSQCDGILVGRKTYEIDQPLLTTRHWTGKNPKKFILTKKTLSHSILKAQDLQEINLIENYTTKLKDLYLKHQIGVLLVEGGSETLQFFIDHQLWDEARVITNSKLIIGSGIKAPSLTGRKFKQYKLLNDIIYQFIRF